MSLRASAAFALLGLMLLVPRAAAVLLWEVRVACRFR